jgi:hypothetical protein
MLHYTRPVTVRMVAAAAAALAVAAGCGSNSGPEKEPRPAARGTLASLLTRPGDDVALVPGTQDYQPGPVRYSFLLLRDDGKAVERPRAHIWVSTGLHAKPFARTTARLEAVGVPGAQRDELDVKNLYVARFKVSSPGRLWVVAEPVGGGIQGVGELQIRPRTASPPLGARAFPSRTPTLSSLRGRVAELTTRIPPDRPLLRSSVAESLRARKPFVLVFATPKFCTSRTCGPVVDVVDSVRRRFAGSGVRFMHVEIYEHNKPPRYNRWFRQWHLPSEPWTFLVGADGRIKAKFEGSVSARELAAAVRRDLLS